MYLDSVLRIYYLAEFKYFVYGLYCNLNMPDLQNKDSPLCLIKMKILKKNIPKRHCLVFLVCFTWFCSGPVLESGNYTLSGLQSAKTLLFVAPSCCIIYTVIGKIRPYLPCFGTSLLRISVPHNRRCKNNTKNFNSLCCRKSLSYEAIWRMDFWQSMLCTFDEKCLLKINKYLPTSFLLFDPSPEAQPDEGPASYFSPAILFQGI